MPKFSHVGRDKKTRAKFRIAGFNQEQGTVDLHFKKDGWDSSAASDLHLPWAEFIQGLIDGRYEISPTKHSSPDAAG